MIRQREELLKLAKNLVLLLEGESENNTKDVYETINKISAVAIGICPSLIPADLKRGLGVSYATAMAETDIGVKATYTRGALSHLRTAIILAHGSKKQLDATDYYINQIGLEIRKMEMSEEEPRTDGLWLILNRSIDYLTLMIFTHKYGEINQKGSFFGHSGKGDGV
jgi:hypothetical protein